MRYGARRIWRGSFWEESWIILIFTAFVQRASAAGAGVGLAAGGRRGLLFVIRVVEPAAFEYNPAPAAYQAVDLAFTGGALLYGRVLHRLEEIERLTAF